MDLFTPFCAVQNMIPKDIAIMLQELTVNLLNKGETVIKQCK